MNFILFIPEEFSIPVKYSSALFWDAENSFRNILMFSELASKIC